MSKILRILFAMPFCLSVVQAAGAAPAENPYRLPGGISKEFNSIRYMVSPQIELVSIVQTISEYPTVFGFLMQKESFPYKQEVLKKFGPFKDHPLVTWFNTISAQPRKMNFSAPSNLMLYADEYLDLRTDLNFDDFVVSRAGGLDSLRRFLDLLKDFAVRSGFNDFYESHTGYYTGIIADTIAQLDSVDHIKELEAFYGTKQKSYAIVLVSLYSHVGYGNSIVYKDGEREMFDTMGPQKIKDGAPFFGDKLYLKYLSRHEFSHPFVNPLTEKYWDQIKDYAKNYDSIPEAAKKNVCGDWQECINEFIVRAVSVYLASLESKELGLQVYAEEKSKGVSYLDPLLAALRTYADNRSRYPNFESYYPKVLEVFKK
jgi:hypothetical protein